MAPNSDEPIADIARDVIDAVDESERSALDAVRRFVDSVDRALPGSGSADDPSRRVEVIDAALKMVEHLLSLSNDFAGRLAETVQRAVPADMIAAAKSAIDQVPIKMPSSPEPSAAPAKKAPAKKAAPAKQAAAKKAAPAKKAPAKKA